MKLSILAIVSGFVAYATAAPAHTPYVVHEKRSTQTEKWSRRSDIKLNRDAVFPMSFGLTQRNLENGYDFLMDVSHPESKNYGKHWTMEKVSEACQCLIIEAHETRSPTPSHHQPRLSPLSRSGSLRVVLKVKGSQFLKVVIGSESM
jgi:hypothetical protein